MKLSHLSLAILSALALSACGGSSSKSQTKDPEPPKPPIPPVVVPDVENESTVVDPTDNDVVVQFKLAEKPSVGQLTYIRGEKSNFNINEQNEGKNSAASAFVSLPLETQNPHMTNIVMAQLTDAKGKEKIAQFAGSLQQDFDPANADDTLQAENAVYHSSRQAAVSALDAIDESIEDMLKASSAKKATEKVANTDAAPTSRTVGDAYFDGQFRTIEPKSINGLDEKTKGHINALAEYAKALQDVLNAKKAIDDKDGKTGTDFSNGSDKDLITQYNNALDALRKYNSDPATKEKLEKALTALNVKANAERLPAESNQKVQAVTADPKKVEKVSDDNDKGKYALFFDQASWQAFANKYGVGVMPFEQANTYAGWHKDSNGAEKKASDSGLYTGQYTKTLQPDGSNYVATGEEANNAQTTRIFGHFYLAPTADVTTWTDENPTDILNSYSAPVIYVDNSNQKQLGAAVQHLHHVQYGRVTAKVDPEDGTDAGFNGNWKLKRVGYNAKGEKEAVDYYFARGTYATTLKQMDALPKDTQIAYRGHALTWGLDNAYSFSKDLPNSFGTTQKRGIGNFVTANLNMANRELDGKIYNAWVDYDEAKISVASDKIEEQDLVKFQGKVTGNSVVGTAYLANDKENMGDLRATFFGDHAQEVAGTVNSTRAKDIYGNAKWGGVFGAKQVPLTKELADEIEKIKLSNKWLGDAN